MVAAGADLIVGASSHFIGEIEMINTDNGNKGLCYYSVGNFCSSFNYSDAMVGGLARITLQVKDNVVVLDETKTGITPIVTHYTHTEGNSDANIVGVYPIWLYTSEMANSHGIITRAGVPFSMSIIEKIISEKIDQKYLLDQ
jgi:poly-gamma-glutamate synthesis protein (capsule biosynthesis protein)